MVQNVILPKISKFRNFLCHTWSPVWEAVFSTTQPTGPTKGASFNGLTFYFQIKERYPMIPPTYAQKYFSKSFRVNNIKEDRECRGLYLNNINLVRAVICKSKRYRFILSLSANIRQVSKDLKWIILLFRHVIQFESFETCLWDEACQICHNFFDWKSQWINLSINY